MNYTVIYEVTPTGFSAYLPDLPGCVAAGTTRAEVERLIRSAVEMPGGEDQTRPS
jgi:predicted RNase H-like HicB family nuclease